MFPENPDTQDNHNLRDKEKFTVNFARGPAYFNSTIPRKQRLLTMPLNWKLFTLSKLHEIEPLKSYIKAITAG